MHKNKKIAYNISDRSFEGNREVKRCSCFKTSVFRAKGTQSKFDTMNFRGHRTVPIIADEKFMRMQKIDLFEKVPASSIA